MAEKTVSEEIALSASQSDAKPVERYNPFQRKEDGTLMVTLDGLTSAIPKESESTWLSEAGFDTNLNPITVVPEVKQ